MQPRSSSELVPDCPLFHPAYVCSGHLAEIVTHLPNIYDGGKKVGVGDDVASGQTEPGG